MLGRRHVVLAKVEGTYGSDPTPDVSNDGLYVRDLELSPEIDNLERVALGTSLERIADVTGKYRYTVSFTAELKGSGSAGVAPKGLSALFKACGLSETIVSSTSVTYAPNVNPTQSCTIYAFKDGKKYILSGCVGNVEIELTAGELPLLKFTFSALYATPTDSALPSSVSVNTTVPVKLKNLTATFDSYAAVIRSMMIRMNNEVTERPDLTATHGIRGFAITDMNPDAEIVLEMTLLATKNWYTKLEADTAQALSIAIGATGGNICTIAAAQCHVRNVQDGVEDGILTHTLQAQLAASAGGDSLTITMT